MFRQEKQMFETHTHGERERNTDRQTDRTDKKRERERQTGSTSGTGSYKQIKTKFKKIGITKVTKRNKTNTWRKLEEKMK